MGTAQGRGRIVVLWVGAAACIVWLSLMVSPEVEVSPPADAEETLLAPPVAKPAPEPEPEPAPKAVVPHVSEREAQAPSPVEEKPERIPTPHPMSLDQSKPPEQFGALSELKKQYDSESRDDTSSETENHLHALIKTPNIPSELVQDITCRRSLCKIEAHWTPRRRIGFSVLSESLKNMYSQRVAIEPAPAQSADGSYVTTLYVRLK